MVFWIYNSLLTLFLLLSLPVLPFFFLSGRRYRQGFFQRIGFYPREVRELLRGSRPIWVHAVSVGEVRSASYLAGELKERFPKRKILLSTFTAAGNEMARQSGAGDGVIFLPFDHPWIVRRALKLFDPSVIIFLETEIWPNFFHSAHRRGVPILLLSCRISPWAFRRYLMFRHFFSGVVRQLTAVGAQSDDDARRMVSLGADAGKVRVTGSLKFAAVGINGKNGAEREADLGLRRKEGRSVFVAGSTHRGEEEVLLDSFLAVRTQFPDLLMVLAPRHPHRFEEVERLLRKKGVRYEKRSEMDGKLGDADVIFLDTLGDLPALYALADVVFVGGSLVDAGGHNLMEPARLRKPILFGPYMTNFSDITQEVKGKGGGIEVRSGEELIRELSSLLADRERAERIGAVAYAVVEGDHGVVERTMGLISRYLQP